MAKSFLDKSGVTTLVSLLKTKFQEPLVSGVNIKTVNGNSLLGGGDIPVVSNTTRVYSFTTKSAGASGYFQITWSSTLPNRPISVYVHTTSISALNGTQFSVVNVTTTGCYITYYCPNATTSTISLTIYAYYKE